MATRAESASLSLLSSDDDDEDVVLLHTEPTSNRRPPATNLESFVLPRPYLMDRPVRSITPAQREAARRDERRRTSQPLPPPTARLSNYPPLFAPPRNTSSPLILPGQQPPQQQRQQSQNPAVIDLTEEPDSPVQVRAQPPRSRNPRRTSSVRASPPRLARSDGSSFVTPSVTHIDLTADSPDDERPSEPRRLRPPIPRGFNRFPGVMPDELISFEIMNATAGLARGFGRHLAGLFSMDVRGNFSQPQLNVSVNSFQPSARAGTREPETEKPPLEPVPPPRKGFTRDTCLNPDEDSPESVVICPACNEELAYDPSEGASQAQAPVAGKKRKRAPGEHHFWALKKCGHVYCADCFENRKPTKAAPRGVGFRLLSGETPLSAPNDIRCAVDDCETKVAPKTEWVGIFL